MSILDDAIREHLELKRAHGADEAEVKRLEDEAFGAPGRPDDADPLAEAPTEFLGTPPFDAAEAGEEPSGRPAPNITDLQEAPPAPQEEEPAAEAAAADAPPEPAAEDPEAEEREAIAEQPTEFFDVEADLQADAPDAAERPSPTDEQLLDSQLNEPRLAPAEPLPAEDAEIADEEPSDEYEEDDEFFSEQRLSDELHQALDAPVTDEHEALPEHKPLEEETAIYDVEDDEEHGEDESTEHNAYEPETGSHEDVLEDTPDFLENAPDDDDLWFEQRPPKDFDFDD